MRRAAAATREAEELEARRVRFQSAHPQVHMEHRALSYPHFVAFWEENGEPRRALQLDEAALLDELEDRLGMPEVPGE